MPLTDPSTADFLGTGWSFPPSFSPTSGGVEMTTRVDDIQRSLHILLTTAVGERVMQPKYGCNMEDLLFEALDTGTKTLIEDRIRTAILYFEPRIEAGKIVLNDTQGLEGVVLIEIEYRVRATNNRFNFVYPYYRGEGTELQLLTTNTPVAL